MEAVVLDLKFKDLEEDMPNSIQDSEWFFEEDNRVLYWVCSPSCEDSIMPFLKGDGRRMPS